MIRVFLSLLACIAGTWYVVDTVKQNGPGYVLIAYNDYTIETSFWVALGVIVIFMLLVYALLKILVFLSNFSARLGLLPVMFSQYRSLRLEHKGIQAFIDQSWPTAGEQLTRAARHGSTPFLDHLMAARSWLAMHNLPEAGRSLLRAQALPDADSFSLSLLALDMAIIKGDLSTTYRLLNGLLEKSPGKPAVLSRAITVYSVNNNWQALQPLLPKIKKLHVVDDAAFLELQARVAAGLIDSAPGRLAVAELQTVLKGFSSVRNRPEVIHSYCSALLAIGETADAEKRIRKQLDEAWDDRLIALYATIKTSSPREQLGYAEQFLATRRNNPILLQSLARLAISSEQWGKARDYLQQSLQLRPSVETYRILAEISEAMHDSDSARRYLKQGMELALAKPGQGPAPSQ